MAKKRNLKRSLVIAVFLVAVVGMSCPALAMSWRVTQVTDDIYGDYHPQISGSNVVWEGEDYDYSDYEMFMAVPAPTIYVDAGATGGANNGTSWENAYLYLQDALDDPCLLPVSEIWVAAGAYKPDEDTANPGGSGDRTATFQLINRVAIKGGYAGFGGPDPNERDVELYETILSGDINTPGDSSDNSYHVVTGSGTDPNAVLDGFTITAGNADGANPYNKGGGMYNRYSAPTVTNCTFSGNSASLTGGGISSYNSSPIVTNCVFSGNSSDYVGGGMYSNYSSPTVTNCTFIGNSAYRGGGMYNFSSSLMVTNCTFGSNWAVDVGGGMYNWNNSSPTVSNCILWGNTASNGNEIFNNDTNSTPVISYCDIAGSGGSSSWDPNLGTDGGGNIDADPCFVDADTGYLQLRPGSPCIDAGDNNAPNLPPTDLAGNPRIIDGDGDGNSVVDMGAFELWKVQNVTQGRFYTTIQPAINDSNDGDEIEVAPGTYLEAINFNGKAIRLYSSSGPGVTTIDATILNSSVVTCNNGEDANTIIEGFRITGGQSYRGGGMLNDGSSPTVTNCIFYGNTGDYGGGMYNGYDSNSTVTNCTFEDNTGRYWGAGMYNKLSNPTVTNCTFLNNTAEGSGGGIHNDLSSPTVTDCNFITNTAVYQGGGMRNINSSPTVNNCTFMSNTTLSLGGGMTNWENSSPTVTNCMFSGNQTKYDGGGMYNGYDSNPTVTNCTFTGNTTDQGGGGMYNISCSPTVTNCTFSGNSVAFSGGGMWNYDSSPTVTNCILWGNTPREIYDSNSTPTVTYSNVQGGYTGTGNINADPLFVNASGPDGIAGTEDDNVHLQGFSPCINAGDPSGDYSGQVDIDGQARVAYGRVDMGVDEVFPAAGDFEPDGDVDFADFAEFALYWMETNCGNCGGADLTCDGDVDFYDLKGLTDNWLLGVSN